MISIAPTITVTTPADYAREIEKLRFAPRLHIDIADGEFAPNLTVNLNQVYWDKDKIIDLHLMIRKPIDWLHQIVALHPSRAIFHVESDEAAKNLPKIRKHLAKFGIKFGVAILPETRVKDVRGLVAIASYVLIFGGRLGFQGGTADLTILKKVAQIREVWNDCHPELDSGSSTSQEKNTTGKMLKQVQHDKTLEIAWDGGANAENVREIVAAGVDIVNVGSAIAKNENPEKAYDELMRIANKNDSR